ncbi:MAG: hypothetical protein K6F48_03430 [Paludibacteraceae bacterium]|nr:hypothetical protein [Paludibacteraceae bacterium]
MKQIVLLLLLSLSMSVAASAGEPGMKGRESNPSDYGLSMVRPAPTDGGVRNGNIYLIVTTDKYNTAVAKFVRWKTIQGFNCIVLTKPSWTDCDEVLSEIKETYDSVLPKYLLIFGDVEDVPSAHYACEHAKEYFGVPYFLSDVPYTTLRSPLNILRPDMIHGRISVSNEQEANVVVDKIINYERFPVEDEAFYNTSTHYTVPEDVVDENGDGIQNDYFLLNSELIRNYMMGWGKTVNREYIYGNTLPTQYMEYCRQQGYLVSEDLQDPSVWQATRESLSEEINKGRFYVMYSGHGGIDGWHGFTVDDVSRLANGNKLPVVYSETCLSGSFGAPSCFAESMLRKEDGGSVGIVAASMTAHFLWNEALNIGMFNSIYPSPGIKAKIGQYDVPQWFLDSRNMDNGEPCYEMGKVLQNGKFKMVQMLGDTAIIDSIMIYMYHYFGDPSMEIYTETPACLDPSIVQNGSTVSVNTNGVDGCKIVLSSLSGDHILVEENAGSASFTDVTFPYTVFISKHNYKPYVAHSVNYLQDENVKYNRDILADSIIAGSGVTSLYGGGDVVVNGGKLTLVAKNSIQLKPGFKTNGGKLLVHKGTDYICPFSYDEPVSVFNGSQMVQDPDDPYLTKSDAFVSADGSIYVDGNTLVLKFMNPTDVEVYDMLGRVVYTRSGLRQGSVDLNRGVYTVKYGDSVKKILISEER